MGESLVRGTLRRIVLPASWRPRLPSLLVVAAVGWSLWWLRAELTDAWYLNDSAIHASMVRWAAERIREGHLPFDGWYPYLSLGSSRFHHYQSLPHILTGAATWMFGASTFRWSAYLLLATWPISVYVGGRLMGLGRWPSASAALVSPLLVSAPGLGYEWGSYLWRGSGTWAQLWGMWALPIAWGLSWRAVSRGSSLALTAMVLGCTIALHLLTGYLALLTLGVWVVVARGEALRRLVRAAVVGIGAVAVAGWMLVPLVADAGWTIQDEFSRGTYYYDSFGAGRVTRWLVTGQLFDGGRLPVVSALVGIGLVIAVVNVRGRGTPRAILGAGVLSLLLFFGRPTLGPILDLMPGGGELFLRRYISGVHLAGLYLAGLGGTWLGRVLFLWLRKPSWARAFAPAVAAAFVIVATMPAWSERAAYARANASMVSRQTSAQATEGRDLSALVSIAQTRAPGRIFADSRARPDAALAVGAVPGHAALLGFDADAIGFTRPTWSIVSGVETRFDPRRASHDRLFGVRYVITAHGTPPSGVEIARAGRFVLWENEEVGYLDVVDTVAPISVDRRNLGRMMGSFLTSGLFAAWMHPTLDFGGRGAAPPTLAPARWPTDPPGEVLTEDVAVADGVFSGTVRADREAVVLFKASFDPRWRISVDGTEAPPQLVAPGFLGVQIPAGQHEVRAAYVPYPSYGILFVLAVVTVVGIGVGTRRGHRPSRRPRM